MKSKEELLDNLRVNLGYFFDEDIDDMIRYFSEDYHVVIKYFSGDRDLITLKGLKDMPRINPKSYKEVSEVFLSVMQYRKLFE